MCMCVCVWWWWWWWWGGGGGLPVAILREQHLESKTYLLDLQEVHPLQVHGSHFTDPVTSGPAIAQLIEIV